MGVPARLRPNKLHQIPRALRVLARENPDVDDGWLCDKGRFAYQSFHVDERVVEPLVRDGGQLRPVVADVGHLVCDDQMVLRINCNLHIISGALLERR